MESELNNCPTFQHTKKTVTFMDHNKSGAAPGPGWSRLVAWDEGLTDEYQEVPWVVGVPLDGRFSSLLQRFPQLL